MQHFGLIRNTLTCLLLLLDISAEPFRICGLKLNEIERIFVKNFVDFWISVGVFPESRCLAAAFAPCV